MGRLTHDEIDRRVEEAMKPPSQKQGQNFDPGIQGLRQAAARKGLPTRKELPPGRN